MSERLTPQFDEYEQTPRLSGTEFQPDDEVYVRMSNLISLDEVRARRTATAAATERMRPVEHEPQLGHEIAAATTAKVTTLRHDKLEAA